MQVLCNKHKLSFPLTRFIPATNAVGNPGDANYQAASPGRNEYADPSESVTVKPSPEIQTIPDWVRETNTFKAAVSAKKIFEVNVLSPAQLTAPELASVAN